MLVINRKPQLAAGPQEFPLKMVSSLVSDEFCNITDLKTVDVYWIYSDIVGSASCLEVMNVGLLVSSSTTPQSLC